MNFTLARDGAVSFALFTADGKIVLQWKQRGVEGANHAPVNLAGFAVGQYITSASPTAQLPMCYP